MIGANPDPGFSTNDPGARGKQQKAGIREKTIKHNTQAHWPQTWEGIFDGVPPATGTETEQQRHLKRREPGEMTEQEKGEHFPSISFVK